jgi:predicted O-linked N-acetylglucosamine transferase (SPINDLY family)
MCPKGSQEYFSERIIRVPYFYVREPIISSPEPLRDATVDLSTIVFGSFNNPSKINDEVLSTWGDILRATPGSRLRLGYLNAYADPVLCDRILAGLHVEIDRVIFETSHYPSLYEHLARYNRIDIALDTFPFNGSTTTFEALWMGVPVLSYCGDRVFNRWTASMMTAVGLQALIAPNRAALAAMAASLAADTLFMKTLRKHLRTRVQNSYMCRPRVARRHLDRLYRAMWRQYCAH